MGVRVRFAPSPTGHLHVGGARTALFNWLFARKSGGTFILRIEDTDLERSSGEMVREIVDALEWMGIDPDEGPVFQTDRRELYLDVARALIENGHAYHCFCSRELLETKRNRDPGTKTGWKYDRTCLGLDPMKVRERLDQGEPAAVRFRVPPENVRFEDEVLGTIERGHDDIEDFILLRSGGDPTYHLSVVADDLDMKITHVIRGVDHLSNTPKQVLIYRALGSPEPRFVHAPLILGTDKARLSKRHGATSVQAYRDLGILPEAFVNFLALLGWSPGSDDELFDRSTLIEAFSLDGVAKSNAVFSPEKLEWFNGQHINRMPVDDLVDRLRGLMVSAGSWEDRLESADASWLRSLLELIRPRFRLLTALAAEVRTYSGDHVEYESAAVEKFFKDPKLPEYLPGLADAMEALDPFGLEETEKALRDLAARLDVKAGLLINASRVCLTGKAVAPGIFDVMVILGKVKTVSRIRRGARELIAD